MVADTLHFALSQTTTTTGVPLAAIADERPSLFVFLRHFGCTFCREAVSDLVRMRPAIEERARLVVVHMGSPSEGTTFLTERGLPGVDHVSDPKARLYEAFGLERGTASQLFGPAVWRQGFSQVTASGFSRPTAFVCLGFSLFFAVNSCGRSFTETPANGPVTRTWLCARPPRDEPRVSCSAQGFEWYRSGLVGIASEIA